MPSRSRPSHALAGQVHLLTGPDAPASQHRGLFITFEGGEGTGKTTQLMQLETRLKAAGRLVKSVREPGNTQLGDYVRRWVKQNPTATPLAEALLFAAARANLVEKVIQLELARGVIVISDRYADSTVAYQGHGRGVKIETVKAINRIATMGISPDLTVLLDLDPVSAQERIRSQASFLQGPNVSSSRVDSESELLRFERESLAFHERVREGYLRLADEEPERWLVLDAKQQPSAIANLIWERLRPLLEGFLDR